MKALFVHDHLFMQLSASVVATSGGKLPYPTWKRYLQSFDQLTVVGRLKKNSDGKKNFQQQLSSGPRVKFLFAPNVARFRGRGEAVKKAINLLQSAIEEVDFVIARTSELGRLAAGIAHAAKKPYVVEVVGCAWDAYRYHGNFLGKLYAPVAYLKQRQMVSKAPNAIYVTSHALQNKYPCFGATESISNVEIPELSNDVLINRLKRCREQNPLVFGTIASLETKYKGVQDALAAFSIIKKNNSLQSGFSYRILGSGNIEPWKRLAKKLGISEEISFDGCLESGPMVWKWLDNIDVYLQPSHTEGLPRTLVEAMSRGCPCIGSAVGGIPELLDPENIHLRHDRFGLAQKIVRSSNDLGWREEESTRNFHKAQLFQSAVLNDRRKKFFNQILVGNRS